MAHTHCQSGLCDPVDCAISGHGLMGTAWLPNPVTLLHCGGMDRSAVRCHEVLRAAMLTSSSAMHVSTRMNLQPRSFCMHHASCIFEVVEISN